MNKTEAQLLNKKLADAVNKVLKDEGLEGKTKMVWSTNGEIKFTVDAASKETKKNELIQWTKAYCFTYKEGQKFKVAGKTLVLHEYKTRGRKFQWTARCFEDGKIYKLTTDQVRAALK